MSQVLLQHSKYSSIGLEPFLTCLCCFCTGGILTWPLQSWHLPEISLQLVIWRALQHLQGGLQQEPPGAQSHCREPGREFPQAINDPHSLNKQKLRSNPLSHQRGLLFIIQGAWKCSTDNILQHLKRQMSMFSALLVALKDRFLDRLLWKIGAWKARALVLENPLGYDSDNAFVSLSHFIQH